MIHFYSNVNVFGCYIIVTWILSVSNITNGQRVIRGNFNETGGVIYSFHRNNNPCLKEGIIVDSIELYSNSGVNLLSSNFLNEEFKSDFKDLIEKVTLDCNGKNVCNSSYSGRKVPRPTLNDIPVDYIYIRFYCEPTSIDNITVFNVRLDLNSKKLKSYLWYYLVLRLDQNNTRRHCKIHGNNSYVSITVLHVDFGPKSECNKINSDSLLRCHENMTLVSRVDKDCNFTWQPPFTYKPNNCYEKEVDIDIHMSTGFVWIKFRGGSELNCKESNSVNDDTSYNPTSETTHSHKNQTLVTDGYGFNTIKTLVTDGNVSSIFKTSETNGNGSSTTKSSVIVGNGSNTITELVINSNGSNTIKTSESNGNGSNTNRNKPDSGQFDNVYKIAIPVNVAFLAFLAATMSFVFYVCRRRESKRNSNYDVTSTRKTDIDPYNGASEVPHASPITDYLNLTHCEDVSLEPTVVYENQDQEVMYEEIGI